MELTVTGIDRFEGKYRFLSNFYPCEDLVVPPNYVARTVEHAYQSSKAVNLGDMKRVLAQDTPAGAKRMGRKIQLRQDWDDIKLKVMEYYVWRKFQSHELQTKMLATGHEILQEGNHWGDTYWGIDLHTGEGENHLGRILMKTRRLLRGQP